MKETLNLDVLRNLAMNNKIEPGMAIVPTMVSSFVSDVALLSIAMSLKRIADNMETVTDYRFDEPAIKTRD